jgi:hypothetical protein
MVQKEQGPLPVHTGGLPRMRSLVTGPGSGVKRACLGIAEDDLVPIDNLDDDFPPEYI